MHHDSFEIPYKKTVYLACVVAIIVGLLAVLFSKAKWTHALWKFLLWGLSFVLPFCLTLYTFVLSTLLSIYTIAAFTLVHLHPAWYFMAAFAVIPIAVDISKQASVPFLVLYCITALFICCTLPGPKPKKPIEHIPAESRFFAGMRITLG